MTKATAKNDVSFEQALSELEKIVRSLESGTQDLASSIEAYERGVTLKKICEEKLKEAESRIEKISLSPDGTVKTEATSLKD